MKKYIFYLSLSLTSLLTLHSCSYKNDNASSEKALSYFSNLDSGVQAGGTKVIPITTPKGTFNVWTKRIGNNPSMKVLILHGGPDRSHDGYECIESFLPKEGIEFIYYDQLACGNSDNPKNTSLYDLPRYVEEVEQVRKAFMI
jgi:proline iminopeptidase